MSFKIIAGPANSGKSQRLCRDIVKEAKGQPDKKFIIIVPEQFTLQMQRRVVETSKNHAVMNIDIVSFNRLALKVFNELGINLNEVLDDTGKVLVLRKVLEENADELCLYKGKIHMEGFMQEIKSVIAELKTYGVKDEDLKTARKEAIETNPELSKKLGDIRLIYRKFNEEIENVYTTSEEVPDIFARVLYKSKLLAGANIYLDGFTGFTPVQYRILEGFLGTAENVTVAITAPLEEISGRCMETSLFYMPNETYRRLIDTASAENIKAEIISYEPVSSSQAAADLVNISSGNQAKIFAYEAKSKKEEAFFAAKEISRLVRQEGFRYREIAVVATDMEGYFPYLEKAFNQMQIPAFIDYKEKITDNRLARFILAALRVVKEKFSYESVFSYLKCGLTDLLPDEISRLENYCIEFGIRGPVIWSRPFSKNRTLKGDKKAWDLDEINSYREKFMASAAGFASSCKRAKTAQGYSKAFEMLFAANSIPERLEEIADELKEAGDERMSAQYGQIYTVITGIIEKAQILTGDCPIELDDYIKIIKSAIAEIKIGLIPPTLDMLTAGDLERSRLNKIKALFILGANEGSLPKLTRRGGILNASDRQVLKTLSLQLAPSEMESFYAQRYYLYLMINKPKNYLYLCRHTIDDEGGTVSRSEVFDSLSEYMPQRTPEEITFINPADSYYEEEAGLNILAGQIRHYAAGDGPEYIDEGLFSYFCERRPAEVKKIIESAFYVNKESLLDEEISKALYGQKLNGSVSRFESFNECAFRHFLSYGIGISPRPEYEIKPAALGSIYHSALEKYVKAVIGSGCSLREIDDETSRKIALCAAGEAISEEESRYFESSARAAYQAQRTRQVIIKTTDIIRRKVKEGRYDPLLLEERFRMHLEDGSTFSGIIDRIDIYDTGDDIYVNVVDYKTGSKKISLQEMADGVSLQLPVYLYCAADILERQNPSKQIHPEGISYFLVKDEFESEKDKEKDKSHVISLEAGEEKMEALMEYAREKLLETGENIKKGRISPEPLKVNGKCAVCEYCDFKEVCRFKEGDFLAKAKESSSLSKEELEGEIYG